MRTLPRRAGSRGPGPVCRSRLRRVLRPRRAWAAVSGCVPGRLVGGLLGSRFLGISDAGAEKADQGLADRLPRLVDVVHGELALVELAVLEFPPYSVGDDVLYALRCGLREGLDGRLHGVREHQDPGLLGTG